MANHIVSVDPDPATGGPNVPGKAICTPDIVVARKGDTVQWFSNEGSHTGEIDSGQTTPDSEPFKEKQAWNGAEKVASLQLTVAKRGVFKYSIKLNVKGVLFTADPEVVGR
jgi:plastocyanin